MGDRETTSVSRGVFVFKNSRKRTKKSSNATVTRPIQEMFTQNLWYQQYSELWSSLNPKYERLTVNTFATMASDLLHFVKTCYENVVTEIPTAALLTGINMPDHGAQFKILEKHIRTTISPHVAVLNSQDCNNVKSLIENMIIQFMNRPNQEDDEVQSSVKKSNINLGLLQCWYEDLYLNKQHKQLIVILPDFEGFSAKVLQTFILIVSHYLNKLPFVFVMGIATSISTLHTSFPYHVTSKINIHVFECEPSVYHLNSMLERLFLTPFCPFQLGGKVFDLFTEIFLYYDFSVRNFMQNIKFAMMEHFCYGNAMALCQFDKRETIMILKSFTHEDFENVRQLMSFRQLVESESYENRIKLIEDDSYFCQIIMEKITNIQRYIRRFHVFLKCLHALVNDLPGAPLGKNLREIYALAASTSITETPQYKEAFQLLNFQSKEELCIKLKRIYEIMGEFFNPTTKQTQLKTFCMEIDQHIQHLDDSNNSQMMEVENVDGFQDNHNLSGIRDRKSLKQALLSKKPKQLNRYEMMRKEILDFISKNFQLYLVHYSSLPLHEIHFFDDITIKDKIIGTHRSAVHNALNDPHYYLQCNCCEISNSQIVCPTMPDICIVYKLHLEWGKMINLYDWLLAFLCVVDPKEDDDLDDKSKKVVDPYMQARFTQAVAELEYLGFVKGSKRKSDHVQRLTWGG